jgi:hypothetical protein
MEEDEGEEDVVRGGHHAEKRVRTIKSVIAVLDDAARTYGFLSSPASPSSSDAA